ATRGACHRFLPSNDCWTRSTSAAESELSIAIRLRLYALPLRTMDVGGAVVPEPGRTVVHHNRIASAVATQPAPPSGRGVPRPSRPAAPRVAGLYGLARPGNRGAGRCCTNLRWAACT